MLEDQNTVAQLIPRTWQINATGFQAHLEALRSFYPYTLRPT
jgi:hypothetical protein